MKTKVERNRAIWRERFIGGKKYREISEQFGICIKRARTIFEREENERKNRFRSIGEAADADLETET